MKAPGLLIIYAALLSFTPIGEGETIKIDDLHVECERESGMLDGKYTSYWSNGKKKAQGHMKHNMRSGAWSLWDSTGKLLMTRTYSAGNAWTLRFPAAGYLRSYAGPVRLISEGNTVYDGIIQDSILRSARMWRFIPYDKSNPVFLMHEVIDSLIAFATAQPFPNVAADDEFRNPYMRTDVMQKLEQCHENRIVLGYKIKEDWYYDKISHTGNTAIIAICPVMQGLTSADTVDFGWFYYPAISSMLANIKYHPRHHTIYPGNIDAVFATRCFASSVYKTSNKQNKNLDELYSGPGLSLQRQYWEIAPYEMEQEEWLKYYGN